MVFKLVRIDAEDPNKIELPLGTHLIGRGKFLECDDKRISRNHGHLIITEDSVTLEALHQNPCFFTKHGTEEKQVLKKTFKETLSNGDKFGLLPGSYWYEVLHCTADADSQATDISNTQEIGGIEERVTNNDNNLNDRTQSGPDVDRADDGLKADEESVLNFDLNETVDNAGRSESPSLLDQQNEVQHDSANQSMDPVSQPATSKDNPDPSGSNPEQIERLGSPQPMGSKSPTRSPSPEHCTEQLRTFKRSNSCDSTEGSKSPKCPSPGHATEQSKTPKRSHSPEDGGVKKIKTEPVDVKGDLLVKQDPDGHAGPSSDQAGASNAGDGNKAPAPQPPRERCIYGASCYRRNPAHKAQFAHPGDADWGAGDRAPCPYGASCRKREPRHWQVHEHPPNTHPPAPPPPAGAQVVERRGRVFYINAHAVNFFDDHFQVEDSEGDSVDFDYEF